MTAGTAARFRTAQDKVTRASLSPVAVLLDAVPTSGVPITPAQWARLLAALYPQVVLARGVSRDLAADLYSTVSPSGRAPELPDRRYDADVLGTALEPVRERLPDPDLHDAAVTQGLSTVARHVEMAGRDYTRQATFADDAAIGWARVARGARTCAFCLMLISRGPVYHSGATAGLNDDGTMNAWHIRCDCQAVPVFDRDDWIGKEQYERAQQLWVDITNDYDGRAKLSAFRAAVENRPPLGDGDPAAGRGDVPDPALEVAQAHSAALPDPVDVPDAEMSAALEAAIGAEDWDRFEALSEESDRRDAAREAEVIKAETRARESAARADRRRRAKERDQQARFVRMSDLIEAGWDEGEAYAEAYDLDPDALARDRAVDMLKGYDYTGRTFEQLAKQSYKDYVEAAYFQAEDECRGVLLRPSSERDARVDPRKVFTGSLAYAKKHASEELLEWWENNGRRSFEEHKLLLLGETGKAKRRRTEGYLDRDR